MIEIYSALCCILTTVYIGLLLYFVKGWLKLGRPQISKGVPSTKVTVLIAARNEAQRIHFTIEDVLAQDYPKHLTEFIIVDDHSTDATAEIIKRYSNQGVKLFQLNEAEALNSYKKKAIAKAIEVSTGDLMVATDADCRMGPKWLSTIVGYYEDNGFVMISSPVAYFEEKSLFERLQTLEFGYLIGIGAGFIGNNRASNCNGANLAYLKDVFYQVGGFRGIDDLASGDDELLLQKVVERYPGKIGFLKSPEAIVYTHAKPTVQDFLLQRRRWASKTIKYKDKWVVALGVSIWLFNVSILLNVAFGFFDSYFFKLAIIQFALKHVFETGYLYLITSFFKRLSLLPLLIILSPIHILYFVYIGLAGNNGKYQWKGRTVK